MTTYTSEQMQAMKALLDEEITLYGQIETLLGEKKPLIVKGDLEALFQLDTQLEALTERARNLEQERLEMMNRMGQARTQTLKDFITTVDHAQYKNAFGEARAQLTQSVENIQQLSQANQDLLTQSIRFIEQSVGVIAGMLAPPEPCYQQKSTSQRDLVNNPECPPSTLWRDA